MSAAQFTWSSGSSAHLHLTSLSKNNGLPCCRHQIVSSAAVEVNPGSSLPPSVSYSSFGIFLVHQVTRVSFHSHILTVLSTPLPGSPDPPALNIHLCLSACFHYSFPDSNQITSWIWIANQLSFILLIKHLRPSCQLCSLWGRSLNRYPNLQQQGMS